MLLKREKRHKGVVCVLRQAWSIVLCLLLVIMPFSTEVFSLALDESSIDIIDYPAESSQTSISLNICGDFRLPPQSTFFRPISDIVTNSGEHIAFNVFKKRFRVLQVTCTVENLPEGAQFSGGTFRWTPHEDQAGTYTVTFYVTDRAGNVQTLQVTLDILAPLSEDILNAFEEGNTTDEKEGTRGKKTSALKEKIQSLIQEKIESIKNGNKKQGDRSASSEGTDNAGENTTPYSGEGYTLTSTFLSSAAGVTAYGTGTYNTSSGAGKGKNDKDQKIIDKIIKKEKKDKGVAPASIEPPDMPVLFDPGVSSFNGVFRLAWSDSAAPVYEIQQSRDETFATITETIYASVPFADLDETVHPESGYYYYRVRAWTAMPDAGGLSSDVSNIVVIGIDYERTIDILSFPNRGIFTQVYGAPGTSLTSVTDGDAYTNPVLRLDYDISNLASQFFAGAFFQDLNGVDISQMNTINIRLRGDETKGYPIRMIIELKYGGAVQGVILVSNLIPTYEDLSFSFYAESHMVDEVVILVEDDIDNDGDGAIVIDEFFFSEQAFVADVLPDVVANAGPGLSDEELLDRVEADTALFFYDEVVGPGLVKDTSTTEYSSIAATGFGLTALAILAERYGTSEFWQTVTPEMARERVNEILDAHLLMQQGQQLAPEEYGVSGFFYHFIGPDSKRWEESEVSVVDTALFMVGALVAGEYFGGDVKEKADLLYDNIDWTFFIDPATYQYYMGWKPESTRGFMIPKGGGYLSSALFNRPTDEVLLITLLALGNHFDDEAVRKSYFAYPRVTRTYTAQSGAEEGTEYPVVNSFFGSLFTYLYAHCFFDFENLGPDKTYFAPDAPHSVSVDWWENSRQAFHANRQFCIDQRDNHPFSYNENSWGLSAVQRPDGRYEGRYGGVPFENGPANDGAVALYGPLSSMPFFRSTFYDELPSENEGFQALRYLYDNYFAQVYGPYGFFESYDSKGDFSSVYLGLDQGPIVLMIENYRSSLIWDTLILNAKISQVLDLVFADSFDFIDYDLKDVEDDEVAPELSFGNNEKGVEIIEGVQYLEVSVNFLNPMAKFVIYTDNLNNTIPYSGDGDPAGLVGTIDSAQVAPLYWVVFDEKQTDGYQFALDEATEGKVQDKSDVNFTFEDMVAKRTILDGSGNLAPYPIVGRTTPSTRVFIYFGIDFTGLEAQDYRTDTLTLEIFHE